MNALNTRAHLWNRALKARCTGRAPHVVEGISRSKVGRLPAATPPLIWHNNSK